MKKLLLATIILLTVASVKAQNKGMSSDGSIQFSIGVEPSLPIGDFHTIGYTFGIGGSLQGEYKASSDLGITLSAGYITYSAKDITVSGFTFKAPSYGIVPVLAGFKYYFSPKVYGHGQLGVSIGTSSGATSNFTYSPGIGFYVSNNIDLLLKFTGISGNGGSLNSVGARLAYNFGK